MIQTKTLDAALAAKTVGAAFDTLLGKDVNGNPVRVDSSSVANAILTAISNDSAKKQVLEGILSTPKLMEISLGTVSANTPICFKSTSINNKYPYILYLDVDWRGYACFVGYREVNQITNNGFLLVDSKVIANTSYFRFLSGYNWECKIGIITLNGATPNITIDKIDSMPA